MHTEHQDRYHNGADDDAAMHCLAVFVRDTAYGGMRQTNHPEADQYPEGGHKGRGEDVIRALRGDQFWIDSLQGFHCLT
ncbi:hypothetical protein D3C79_977110 [compost metagenome]